MFIGNQREQLQEEPAQSLPPLSKQRLETGREGVARERQLLAPPKYGLWVEPRWQCEIDIARDLQVFCWPPPAAAANSDRLPHRLRPAPRARSQRQHIITICHAMRAGDLWVDFHKLLRLPGAVGAALGSSAWAPDAHRRVHTCKQRIRVYRVHASQGPWSC